MTDPRVIDPRLDTIPGCLQRLGEIDAEIEEFRVQAYRDAGDLAKAEKDWKDRYDSAMKVVTGANADVRAAICRDAVKTTGDGGDLWRRILDLTGKVKSHDKRYEYLETQKGIVQSVLKTHRGDAERLDPSRYGPPVGGRS